MARFPIEARRERVIRAFERFAVRLVREGNHIGKSEVEGVIYEPTCVGHSRCLRHRLAMPHLKKSPAGVILTMSSVAGRFGYANRSP